MTSHLSIKLASSLDEVSKSLHDALNYVKAPDMKSTNDITSDVRNLFDSLLLNIHPAWYSFLSDETKKTFQSIFLESAFLLPAFHSMVVNVSKVPDRTALTILDLAEKLFELHPIMDLCNEAAGYGFAKGSMLWTAFIQQLCSFPDRVCSLPLDSMVLRSLPDRWWQRITEKMVTNLPDDQQDSIQIQLLAQLVSKLCRTGHSAKLVDTLWHVYDETGMFPAHWAYVFEELESMTVGSVFAHLMANPPNAVWEDVHAASLAVISLFSAIEETAELGESMVLKRRLNLRNLMKITTVSMSTWSYSFDGGSSIVDITVTLLLCLRYLDADSPCLKNVESPLMHGTSFYMESHSTPKRYACMIFTEAVLKKLHPQVQIGFETPSDGGFRLLHDLTTSESFNHTEASASDEVKSAVPESVKKDVDVNDEHDLEPDQIIHPGENPPESWLYEMDDEYEPVVPEENATTLASNQSEHIYLRDCIADLQKNDDPDKVEAALKSLPKSIHDASAVDLDLLSEQLTSLLIGTPDTFEITDFSKHRLNAMTALGLRQSERVAAYLVKALFSKESSVSNRLFILNVAGSVAISASQEMTRSTQSGNMKQVPIDYFYPLINLHSKSKLFYSQDTALQIAIEQQYLTVLALLLQAAANDLQSRHMAREYFNLLWSFAPKFFKESPPVRKTIIFGFYLIVNTLSEPILLAEFSHNSNSLDDLTQLLVGGHPTPFPLFTVTSFHSRSLKRSDVSWEKVMMEQLHQTNEQLHWFREELTKQNNELTKQNNDLKHRNDDLMKCLDAKLQLERTSVALKSEAIKYLILQNKLNLRGAIELAVERIQDKRRRDKLIKPDRSGKPRYIDTTTYMEILSKDPEWIAQVTKVVADMDDGGATLKTIQKCQSNLYHRLSKAVHGYSRPFDLSSIESFVERIAAKATLSMADISVAENDFIDLGDGVPMTFSSIAKLSGPEKNEPVVRGA
ncbi:TEL2, telomere maintenance protein 2 [Blyttiomyces sp. JEL0837]|nr:TEL2, telomere maintenance protein 2 [Blyttiomyces sp. JEL0837]